MYQSPVTSFRKLFSKPGQYLDQQVCVGGWIRHIRKQTDNLFALIYDGNSHYELQLVIPVMDSETFGLIKRDGSPGVTIRCEGKFVKSIASGQEYELVDVKIVEFGPVTERNSYLPSSKGTTVERIRPVCHLRPLFRIYRSIYRIRNGLEMALHKFFRNQDFLKLDPNVLTTSDCEGAGETFNVSTSREIDVRPKKDKDRFFGKATYLTVSSQLQLEALCRGMGPVYTMNPSFRAEQSKSSRHLACFTHLEYELPFINLQDLMDFQETLVTSSIKYLLKYYLPDLEILGNYSPEQAGLVHKLENCSNRKYIRITYSEATNIINQSKHSEAIITKYSGESGFQDFQIPQWGDDLGSYCERYLCEEVFKRPVFVYNYPKTLKSFYMRLNDSDADCEDSDRQTVQACDLLMPYLGELVGSSIREERYNYLVQALKYHKISDKPLKWYLDLRKNATYTHGGGGLGFDRLVTFCTSVSGNIRDSVPFPVAFGECGY